MQIKSYTKKGIKIKNEYAASSSALRPAIFCRALELGNPVEVRSPPRGCKCRSFLSAAQAGHWPEAEKVG